jgi:hypothetical protein
MLVVRTVAGCPLSEIGEGVVASATGVRWAALRSVTRHFDVLLEPQDERLRA